jgi:hypothetical protein
MEKMQSRGLKFIYDDTDSTYEELLTKSKLNQVFEFFKRIFQSKVVW